MVLKSLDGPGEEATVEVSSHSVVNEGLFVCRFVAGIMSEHGFLIPFTFHLVGASTCSARSRVTELRIQKRIAVQDFFLLPALDFLYFNEFFQTLLLFSFTFEFFVFAHQLLSIVLIARTIFISVRVVALILHLWQICSGRNFAWFGPEFNCAFKLI